VNEDAHQVTVESGLEVEVLNTKILPSWSDIWSISCWYDIDRYTWYGAKFGCLATAIVKVDLLTAEGELISCSRDENKDIFLACCCGIGALGVIVHVTIQCEPAFKLWERQSSCSLTEVLGDLDTHLSASEHFRFFWFPHTNNVAVFHADRTTKNICVKSSWLWNTAVANYSLEFAYWLSTFIPRLVPLINRLYYHMLFTTPSERVDVSYKVLNFDCKFSQYVTEWAIPREKTGEVLRSLQRWVEMSGEVAHFPVEVRFVNRDDILISPAYGRDTCFINIIMYRPYGKFVEHSKYWTAYEDIMMKAGGRPHWAKAHKITREQFLDMYPKFSRFLEIRQQLDPNGMFMNEYLNRVLT
uniref:L-gulonolactone oxidase-like n=1 Tax=Saccoglossus kowalevskii TaxID=10224 RepID=A0ABM0MYT4_SACKO